MRLISNARDLLAAFCETALSSARLRRVEADRDKANELFEYQYGRAERLETERDNLEKVWLRDRTSMEQNEYRALAAEKELAELLAEHEGVINGSNDSIDDMGAEIRRLQDVCIRLCGERDRYRALLEARPSTSFMSESTISQGYFLLHAYKPWDAKVAEALGEVEK